MRVKEDIVVLEDEHPYYESLNKKLLKEAEEVDYSLSYKTNIKAEMSGWHVNSPNVDKIVKWASFLVTDYYNFISSESGYEMVSGDVWFARYGKGDSAQSHHHLPHSIFSFVYYINCPKGSSPLVFTTTGRKIKAEEGKILVFPACVKHHVPSNKCDDRIVLSGNLVIKVK